MTSGLRTRLAELQLLVVTGKGGVGKSAVTAALGRVMARHGRRTLLLEVDPRENLHHLLGVEPSGGDVVAAGPRIWLQHLDARGVLDDLVREKLKVRMLVDRVLDSPIHRHFTEGAPGLKETAVFGRALRLLEGHLPRGLPRPDLILLDAPATGHGVTWLAAPQLVSDVISSGPIGHMAAEIAAFLADRERSGVIVVTAAEEMPVQETLELDAALRKRFDRRPELLVINGLYPPVPASHRGDPRDVLDQLWCRRRAINETQLGRLAAHWQGSTVELPLLGVDRGPELVDTLARHLDDALGGPR
jgi:anion-transporting  ArsA/GET3 family ATPase